MRLLKYGAATILTVLFLPMLAFWLLLDIAFGNNATEDLLTDLWT